MKLLWKAREVLGVSALLCFSLAVASSARAQLRVETDDDGIHVRIGDEAFTTLRHDKMGPFLYPVLGPGGARMTRGYPMDPQAGEADDHPHHRSLWLAHGNVNGYDFWHGREHGETIKKNGKIEPVRGENDLSLVGSYDWIADGKVIMQEKRRLSFAVEENQRRIDVSSTFTAGSEGVVFGDTKEGTMALRLTPTLRLKGDVAAGYARNSQGDEGGGVWGKRAEWVAYAGPIDGRVMTVAIFDDPTNHAHPTWWHARTYGLFAANPFGAHDFEGKPAGTGNMRLTAGESVSFRWRILLREGGVEVGEITDAYAAFASSSRPKVEAWRPIPEGFELAVQEDFEGGRFQHRWSFSDSDAWMCGDGFMELLGPSSYKPPHRSPHSIALLATPAVGSFVFEAELAQTGREYGHRDLCLFFGFQNASQYYYTHIATTPDANACNVFLVDEAPRRNLLEPLEEGVDWGQDVYHRVRVERDIDSGRIQVFFDDMEKPLFDVVDKTHGTGRVGFGSFDDQGRIRRVRLYAKDAKTVRADKPFGE